MELMKKRSNPNEMRNKLQEAAAQRVERKMAHPEIYEEQKEVAGQAQIIIEKQRNGPTGDVELTWLREFTRFEDRAAPRHGEFDAAPGNEYEFPG